MRVYEAVTEKSFESFTGPVREFIAFNPEWMDENGYPSKAVEGELVLEAPLRKVYCFKDSKSVVWWALGTNLGPILMANIGDKTLSVMSDELGEFLIPDSVKRLV